MPRFPVILPAMRWLAAILAVVLAFFCRGYVEKFVPRLGNFLTHHYYPRVNGPVFWVAWIGLAVIFFAILELIFHILKPARRP